MIVLPKCIRNKFPDVILVSIYSYIDVKNNISVKRLNSIFKFINNFLVLENRNRYYISRYYYDNHEIMENYVRIHNDIFIYKDLFHYLNKCHCCSRHRYNSPRTIYSSWNDKTLKHVNTCLCPCRHIKRLLCVVI
jgi:hypothetical protein